MRLLLHNTIEDLGRVGDIVEVADGYGRNYLLPKGLAVAVTPENLRRIDVRKKELLVLEAKQRQDRLVLAERLNSMSVTIQQRAAGEEGKLYGSVTAGTIAEALEAEGLPIEAKMVMLEKPIKELGVFDVHIRLQADVEAVTKVWVVEDSSGTEGEAKQPAAEDAKPA